ncbi:MAG: hypothetical protein RLN72_11045 [Henriciella sp.]
MSARTNYIVAAVVAVAALGATAGYFYLNQTPATEPVTADLTDESEAGATELAEIGADVEAAAAETAPVIELEAVPATDGEIVIETDLEPVTDGETVTVEADTPAVETVTPAQPE